MNSRFSFFPVIITILVVTGSPWLLISCRGTPSDEITSPRTVHEANHPAHWGYGPDNGPAHWGELSPEWVLCAEGLSQSRIDLTSAVSQPLEPLDINFPAARIEIIHQEHVLEEINNGHTIQINYDAGETLMIGSMRYELVQFHFHSPSEHTVNGMHYPMEMHFVHKSADNELAVIGLFISEGAHNRPFEKIWARLPGKKGETVHIEDFSLDIDDMLPRNRTSYRYHGSLTTPPCSEGVRWFVLAVPIEFSSDQINAFRKIFQGNNRPVQPTNNRQVKKDVRG